MGEIDEQLTGGRLRAAIGQYGRRAPTAPRTTVLDLDATSHPDTVRLGLLAPLTLLAALALGAVALADGASRSGESWGGPIFWFAIFACAVPFAFRLAGPRASRSERLGLVIVFGLWLFLVKVLRDPIGFTYADELVHSYNVDRIVETHHLFSPNAILPLTPRYPGLEATTAAVRMLGGGSTFGAGLIVIALSRLLMMIALFVFFDRVTGKPRIAGLAALFYTANANFVFFDDQFSYESLALPLALVSVYAVVRWLKLKEENVRGRPASRFGSHHAWATVAVMMIPAVVVTHHVSSYALAVFIFAIARAQREIRRLWKSYVTPFPFAIFTTIAILAWLLFVARWTWNYLSPVVSDAVRSALDTFTGHEKARQLFGAGRAGTGAAGTPVWDRTIAVSAALLTALGVPFGLRRIWREYRTSPVHLVLGVAGFAYVLTLGLRLAPAAWEIANRASEFLFLGVGLVLALVGLERWRPRVAPWLGRVLLAGAFGVLLGGGVVLGWSSDLVLAKTFEISAGGATLRPEGVVAAQWAGKALGPGHRFAADASNARLLGAYAGEFAIAGTNPDVQAVIRDPRLDGWHVRLLRQYRIPYVLVDRRRVSEDPLAGYFFTTDSSPRAWLLTFDRKSVEKFDRQPAASRLFDSGDIVIYNVSRVP